MELEILEVSGCKIAEVISNVVIKTIRDALDVMANAQYQGADCLIMHEKHLPAEFFDLKTGMAGEILQKYTNYHMRLAVIGDCEVESKSLKAFIVESNRGRQVAFVPDRETALAKVTS